MRLVIGGAILLTIAVVPPFARAQGGTIVPGESIGSVRLGQNIAAAIQDLGLLHSRNDLPRNLTAYYWPLKRIGAIASQTTHRILALGASLDDSYRTDKDIAAGTEALTVRVAYGPEEILEDRAGDQTLIYDKRGVAFVVDKSGALSGRVSVIFIFVPGRYHEIFQVQLSGNGGGASKRSNPRSPLAFAAGRGRASDVRQALRSWEWKTAPCLGETNRD